MSGSINLNAGKAVNVSYSLNARRKSLAVPLICTPFCFGTNMTDPVWDKAVQADDFDRHHKQRENPLKKNRMAVFRTPKELVIGWFYSDVKEERTYPPANDPNASVWRGDLAELHFGAMGPDPWILQLCVGITGIVFDSTGRYNWEYSVFENESGWGGEVKLPLDIFLISEGGMGFNLCRGSLKYHDSYCWSPLYKRFHEVENFGELLFADYDTISTLRSGSAPEKSLDREAFEELRTTWETPADKVIHGPYLSNPEQDSLCISWETAGRLPAFLEYKVQGSSDSPERIFCSQKNGIMASETAHFARLEGLLPDTVYEYELFSLRPVLDQPASSGIKRCFRTAPAKEKEYSFFCVTDLHSDANHLVNTLSSSEAQQSDFHLLLGDNLSHAAGREALYRGIIDPIVSVNQKSRRDIPLVFVRGNHEQLGVFANEYFTVMRHPSGRSWYAFEYGKVFFIILDSGDDKADSPERILFSNNALLAEEKRFLEEVTCSREYQEASYRIAFIHIPPFVKEDVQFGAVSPLADAEIRPDILLSGHWHSYIRIDKDQSCFAETTSDTIKSRLAPPDPLPYCRTALSTDNALHCKVTEKCLELEILRFTPEGEKSLQDKIVLYPRTGGR